MIGLTQIGLGLAQQQGGAGGPLVLSIWGQSEQHRLVLSSTNTTLLDAGVTYPALVDQDRVTFWWRESGTVQTPVTVNDASVTSRDCTIAMAHFANVLMTAAPGRDCKVILHTVPGTSPEELMDDTVSGRSWADEVALDTAATADGLDVQYAYASWFADPRGWGVNYGENMLAFMKGVDLTGAELDYSSGSVDVNGIAVSQTIRDIYPPSVKWIRHTGAHSFHASGDLSNATTNSDGSTNAGQVNIERCTASWREMTALSALSGIFTPETFAVHGYANGYLDTPGVWTDHSHPGRDVDGGIPLFMELTAAAIARGMGLTSHAVPVFDNCAWQSDGSYVEVWSSAGDITTYRANVDGAANAGDAAINSVGPFDHWTNVVGFEVDAEPVERAEIVSGRVRIYPNSGSFTSASVLTFGEGGGTGILRADEDHIAELWKDYPMVDLGAPVVDLVPVAVQPDADVLASTIEGAPTFTVGASGPYFKDSTGPGSANDYMTVKVVGQLVQPADGEQGQVFALEADSVSLDVTSNGELRYNATGLSLVTVSSAISFDGQTTIVMAVNNASGETSVWVDGSLVMDALAGPTPGWDDSREPTLLARVGGGGAATKRLAGTFEELTVWIGDDTTHLSTDGSDPTATPRETIVGPAATANASTWKEAGVDAT